MEHRVLGKTGLVVSTLGFGGYPIGSMGDSSDLVTHILNAALDDGINIIDTAECYGESEQLIGTAIGHRRTHFHLLSKCGHASGIDMPHWNPRLLALSIDRSLTRLRTDFIDIMQLHSCAGQIILRGDVVILRGDVVDVLVRARDAGKIRFLGYSGDGDDARIAIASGAFEVLQTSVNIADQEAIETTIPYARAVGMGVIAKRPIANAVWLSRERPEDSYVQPYWDRLRALAYGFISTDSSSAVGISLRFTLTVPGVHTAIVGTTKEKRTRENAVFVAEGSLPSELYSSIRQRWASIAQPEWKAEN